MKFKQDKQVEAVFYGLRAAIVGLIAAAALTLMNNQNFPDYISVIICVAAFVMVKYLKIHPILMIVISGVVGYFLLYPKEGELKPIVKNNIEVVKDINMTSILELN